MHRKRKDKENVKAEKISINDRAVDNIERNIEVK